MPIKSYLAIPEEGQKEILQQDIYKLPGCEVVPSENKNVLVVVTETEDEAMDKKLFNQLKSLKNLQLLTLVAAFSNEAEPTQL